MGGREQDRRAVPGADRQRRIVVPLAAASARSRTRRWSRSRGARAQGGRPVRSRTACGVDGDDAPPRDALPHADGDEREGAARREVECWFDTGAYADNGPRVTATAGDAAPALPLGGVPRRRRLRLHEHRAGRLLPRLRRDAPAVDRRAAGGRARAPRRASTRWRCDARTSAHRARSCAQAASRSTPTSSGTSRRSRRRSAGTASGSRAPGGACRSACSPPEPTRSRAPSCAWRPTGTQSSSSARPRSARARAPSSPRSQPRS